MKRVIFTAVFENYDKVFPALHNVRGVDCVLFTDSPSLRVAGWRTLPVDIRAFASGKAANNHYRALAHWYLSDYDTSLYIDGNVRVIRPTLKLFSEFEASGADLGIFPHPERNTVSEEIAACAVLGLAEEDVMRAEYEANADDGFGDDFGLFDCSIDFKNHTSPRLHAAMEHWDRLFQHYKTRNQLSLPYIIWKYGLIVHRMAGNSRKAHDTFHFYPHIKGADTIPLSFIIKARARDWALFRLFPLEFVFRCIRLIRKISRSGQVDSRPFQGKGQRRRR